ncbi:MAG TPA: sigma-70 family RNA polymerase sigma factor [Steroidobacter sp.]|nr:sigma-70 family RNA polymerase sigma factor [Steroidobacter sp.]
MSEGLSPAAHLDAVGVLYSEHHGWLRGWLRRRLGTSSGLALDLVQDTFMRILAGPSGNASLLREPRSYLAAVANRVVIDHMRRRTLERAYLEALAQAPQAADVSPETRAIVMETLCEIDAMLEGLGIRARQAFLWSQLEGVSYAVIAERLGVSVSAVKKYVARGVERCLLYSLEQEAR